MKDELQNKLIDILSSMQTAASKAGDFAMAQMPDIAQSYVAYGRASSLISIALCMLGFFLAWRFVLWAKDKDELHTGVFFGSMIGGIATIANVAFFVISINSALLSWFAPKVWLLKEIARLLK